MIKIAGLKVTSKGLIKWIIGEAEGVVGATPEGMSCHILSSVKMTFDARINIFSCIL